MIGFGRLLTIGIGLVLASTARAEGTSTSGMTYPNLPGFVRQAADFVPSNWKTIAIKTGDLNGDKSPDVAVLMRKTDPANIKPVESNPYHKQDNTNPYLLAIGFAEPKGYRLAASHHSLFPREVAPMHGDTPPGPDTIEIKRGILTLDFEHIRSTEQFRFRWNGKAFALIGFDCGGVAGGNYIGLSANYLTLRARIERGEISEDKTSSWTVRIRPAQRPTLDQIDWEYGWIGQDSDGDELSC